MPLYIVEKILERWISFIYDYPNGEHQFKIWIAKRALRKLLNSGKVLLLFIYKGTIKVGPV